MDTPSAPPLGNPLWHSNAMHGNTGYANQTGLFVPRLHKAGYEMIISAFYGVEGRPMRGSEGILELPGYGETYGNDVIDAHMQHWKRDMVITLIDPFVLNPAIWQVHQWCAWSPIDCAPISRENLKSLQSARWTWSMSKFGHEQMEKAGLKPIYVPHGVDTNVFKPVDRAEAREKLANHLRRDLAGKFLVVTVAANKGTPSRKNFAGMMESFALFSQRCPDALFYLHTEPIGHRHGDDLFALAEAWGIQDKVIFPGSYHYAINLYGDDYLNSVYNAADVFILLSYGEGFGIPIIEAQAAGCPVILTDGTSMTELTLSGWSVPALPVQALDGRYGSQWKMAVPKYAADSLWEAYEQRTSEGRRVEARAKAMDYDADKVFADYMLPAMEQMYKELKSNPIPQPLAPQAGKGRHAPISDSRKRRKAKRNPIPGKQDKQPIPQLEVANVA